MSDKRTITWNEFKADPELHAACVAAGINRATVRSWTHRGGSIGRPKLRAAQEAIGATIVGAPMKTRAEPKPKAKPPVKGSELRSNAFWELAALALGAGVAGAALAACGVYLITM